MPIQVHGAGVAGLITARLLIQRGHEVVVHSQGGGCSPHAGGMLAARSELELAEASLVLRGLDAADRWRALVGTEHVLQRGTLHVAHRPEWPLLTQLAARIERARQPLQHVDSTGIAALEPLLAGRFHRGIFLPHEAAVDPEVVLPLLQRGLQIEPPVPVAQGIDARGLKSQTAGLRGVRGEYAVLGSATKLTRPVRLMHPRYPLYVIPRADDRIYVGATQLERSDDGPIEVRSLLELLSALYSLHPDFGDATLLRTGSALRPAYPDNTPRIEQHGPVVRFNGLFRHGYLLGPCFAAQAVDLYLEECHGARVDQ